MVGLTKTLAREWGRYNVTVNAVAFGRIETRLTQPHEGEPPRTPVKGKELRVGLTRAQIAGSQAQSALARIIHEGS